MPTPPIQISSMKLCTNTAIGSNVNCFEVFFLLLQSNEMKQLAFGSHSNLCFLDVGDNHLASLQGLGHTPQLLHLSVTGNRVARIAGVKGCPQLQRLTLDSNLLINSKVRTTCDFPEHTNQLTIIYVYSDYFPVGS